MLKSEARVRGVPIVPSYDRIHLCAQKNRQKQSEETVICDDEFGEWKTTKKKKKQHQQQQGSDS
jgi:hypothetical protein